MERKRIIPVIMAAILMSSCSISKKTSGTETAIRHIEGTTVVNDGSLIYALPRSVFTFDVQLERTIFKPGPYAQYAADMVGLTNAIKSESELWAVKKITLRSSTETDPSEYYVIESSSSFSAAALSLRKEGLIMDLVPAGGFTSAGKGDDAAEARSLNGNYDLGSDEYFQMQRDTAYKRMTIDSSFVRIPYIVEKMKRLTNEQLAEKAAKRLMELRDGKHLILTGEANVFPQSSAAIDEINRLEKNYTELFAGKVIKQNLNYSFQVIPEKSMSGKPYTLFNLSEQKGIIRSGENGGRPVTAEFAAEQKTKELTMIRRKPTEPGSTITDKLYFRIPDVASVRIKSGSEELLSTRALVYQFGEIMQLPANFIF